ncbi:hypothetical protein RHMOL_Rhmol03G0092100 [Rhododendron molle]|uniref:Uncharacterized protein n=1 Tax=Rhododendron molle TaxID=49168 RepID=A0ACC0PDC6_RHOML|nr:hypothetical protein RHMOL_Rhmol03G0092100 [Rhododendron molle]
MARERGKLVYMVYRALSYGLSPMVHLHLRWRRVRGLEHPLRWPERLGRPSLPRPAGPLIWFHAVSLGEGIAAIPVIKCCIERRPDINILMTTTTLSAFTVIESQLPRGVIYQFAPLDIPASVDTFLGHWKPNAIMLIESELWPNLIIGASKSGIALVLLNARMSAKSFKSWSGPLLLPLASLMLSKFSLISPLSTMQALRFQLLQAPPFIINFSGDLKYATETFDLSDVDKRSIEDLRVQLESRRVWMASSIHRGEEEAYNKLLKRSHPHNLTCDCPQEKHNIRNKASFLWHDEHIPALGATEAGSSPVSKYLRIGRTIGQGDMRRFHKRLRAREVDGVTCHMIGKKTRAAVAAGGSTETAAGDDGWARVAAGCSGKCGCYLKDFDSFLGHVWRVTQLQDKQCGTKPTLSNKHF